MKFALLAATTDEPGVIGSYLSDGGTMMYVILALSMVGVMLFFERAFDLYLRRRLNSREFTKRAVALIEQARFREALDACQVASSHPLVTVARAALLRANRRDKEIERAMETEMLNEMPGIQKRVALQAVMANIATLLGLLGTIFGLIVAFTSVAAASAAERQEALAAGISQAMYTTAFGISVAVPLLFFHYLLSTRAEKILLEVEAGASAIFVAILGAARGDQRQ